MSLVKEFKDFAVKGNVVDMAVGIMIGAAFKSIVTSFVNDVVMPPIGQMLGGVNFKSLYYNLSDKAYESLAEAVKAGAPVIKYGAFIQTIIDFLLIALTIFVVIKMMSKMNKEEEPEVEEPAAPAAPAEDIVLLGEIRDLLKK